MDVADDAVALGLAADQRNAIIMDTLDN